MISWFQAWEQPLFNGFSPSIEITQKLHILKAFFENADIKINQKISPVTTSKHFHTTSDDEVSMNKIRVGVW